MIIIENFVKILYIHEKDQKTPHGLSDKDDMLAVLDVYIAQHS